MVITTAGMADAYPKKKLGAKLNMTHAGLTALLGRLVVGAPFSYDDVRYKQQYVSNALVDAVVKLMWTLTEAEEKDYMWGSNLHGLRSVAYLFRLSYDGCYVTVDNILKLFGAVTGWFKQRVEARNETLKSCQDKNANDMAELALTGTTLPLLDVISSLVEQMHPAAAQLAREDAQLARAILDVRDCLTCDLWRSFFTREYAAESDNWNSCLNSETMPVLEQHCFSLLHAFQWVLDETNSLVYHRDELSTIFEATCADGWLRKFVFGAEVRRWTEDHLKYCLFKKLDTKTRKWIPDDNPAQVQRDLIALLDDTFYKLRRLNIVMLTDKAGYA
jgi:hypothetical protein